MHKEKFVTTTEKKHFILGKWLNGADFHSYGFKIHNLGIIIFWGSVFGRKITPYLKLYKLV